MPTSQTETSLCSRLPVVWVLPCMPKAWLLSIKSKRLCWRRSLCRIYCSASGLFGIGLPCLRSLWLDHSFLFVIGQVNHLMLVISSRTPGKTHFPKWQPVSITILQIQVYLYKDQLLSSPLPNQLPYKLWFRFCRFFPRKADCQQ